MQNIKSDLMYDTFTKGRRQGEEVRAHGIRSCLCSKHFPSSQAPATGRWHFISFQMQPHLVITVMSLLYTWGNWVIKRSGFRPQLWLPCMMVPGVALSADRTACVLCQPTLLPVGDGLGEAGLCGLCSESLLFYVLSIVLVISIYRSGYGAGRKKLKGQEINGASQQLVCSALCLRHLLTKANRNLSLCGLCGLWLSPSISRLLELEHQYQCWSK